MNIDWVLVGWMLVIGLFILSAITNILVVGKECKPITPGGAVVTVIIDGLVIAFIVSQVTR